MPETRPPCLGRRWRAGDGGGAGGMTGTLIRKRFGWMSLSQAGHHAASTSMQKLEVGGFN